MNFFTALVKSCYDRAWLTTSRYNAGKAWSYFFLFSALITIVTLVPIAFVAPSGYKFLRSTVVTKVPEFNATISKGHLSITGITQPYEFVSPADQGNFVVVVDTVSTSTPVLASFLSGDQSGVLVSKDGVEVYQAERGEGRTQSFVSAEDGTLTKNDLLQWVNKLSEPKVVVAIVCAMFFAMFVGLAFARLFSLMFVTLMVFAVATIGKQKWQFGQLFTMGLYATTLPTILAILLPLFGIILPRVFLVALLAFMLAVVFTKDSNQPVAKV